MVVKRLNTQRTPGTKKKNVKKLFLVALLADGKGDRKPVARWGKGAGGKGSVGARRIFEAIEIEDEFAGFVEAARGEAGIEEAAGAVGGSGAGCIAEDEEKFGDGGIFENGFETEGFSGEREFGDARNGLIVVGADEGGECDGLVRNVGNPFGGDAIGGVRRVPLEAVEADDGRRAGILDAKREAIFAPDDIHVQSANGEMRRNLVVVGFGAEGLRFRRSACDEEVFWKPSGGRIQGDRFSFEMKDGEMCGTGGEMNLIVWGGADGVVAGLEPFQAGE